MVVYTMFHFIYLKLKQVELNLINYDLDYNCKSPLCLKLLIENIF